MVGSLGPSAYPDTGAAESLSSLNRVWYGSCSLWCRVLRGIMEARLPWIASGCLGRWVLGEVSIILLCICNLMVLTFFVSCSESFCTSASEFMMSLKSVYFSTCLVLICFSGDFTRDPGSWTFFRGEPGFLLLCSLTLTAYSFSTTVSKA